MSILAGAINAAVLRAEPTGLFQTLAQLLPGAMMPHTEIIGRHSQCDADLFGCFALQIEPTNQFRIFRLERGNQSFDTTANSPFFLSIRRGIQFMFQSLQCCLVHRSAAIQVNNRAAQDAVKPRQGFFLLGRLFGRSQRFDQTLLHHIFGEMRIPDATARERHEGFQVRKQWFFNGRHTRILTSGRDSVKS